MTTTPSKETVERMAGLLTRLLAKSRGEFLGDDASSSEDREMLAEARAIAALPDFPQPVDPDVLAVQEIVAREWEERGEPLIAEDVRAGMRDEMFESKFALAAYRAGKEARS